MFTHKCSCGNEYTDNDPEVYFCPSCVEERRKIAEEIDRKIANRPKKQQRGVVQMAEEMAQKHPRYGSTPFFRAGDLGIRF